MKAVLCKSYGPPENLVIEDIPAPVPGPGEVAIAVKACSINFPDVLIIQDKYQFKPPLPFAPGAEISGIVKALGPGVTSLKVGDRILASVGAGGLVEEKVVRAEQALLIPDAMSFEEGASLLLTYGTTIHALKDRAELKAGETLLVMGAAGGTGIAAVELGRAMGARVIAAASSEEKLTIAKKHGAEAGILYPTGALDRDQAKAFSEDIKKATGGKGVDVVYDPVGGDYAEPAVRAMAWKGRYLVIGFASGPIPKIPLNLTLLKGCSIVGVFWGMFTGVEPARNRANNEELMRLFLAGKIKPFVSKVYPLEKAPQAIRDLMDRKATGKLVVRLGG